VLSVVTLSVLTGYAAGTLIALFLDSMYSGAPLRRVEMACSTGLPRRRFRPAVRRASTHERTGEDAGQGSPLRRPPVQRPRAVRRPPVPPGNLQVAAAPGAGVRRRLLRQQFVVRRAPWGLRWLRRGRPSRDRDQPPVSAVPASVQPDDGASTPSPDATAASPAPAERAPVRQRRKGVQEYTRWSPFRPHRVPYLCNRAMARPLLWTGTLGYLLLHGRCSLGCRIPSRLWYLPLVGAVAGTTIALRAIDLRHAALVALFSVFLVAFIGTDFERHLLPNRLMYPALILALALGWAWPDRSAVSSLGGGAAGFGVMFVLYLIVPGFGFGDVRLMGLLGLVAGLSNLLPAVMVAVLAGGVGSVLAGGLRQVLLLFLRRKRPRAYLAYGPYLALGAFAGMLMR
jgi:prepilin signal peptidase PulO-like enzyme (type II secretory pathway)